MTNYIAVDLETTGLFDKGYAPDIICASYADEIGSGVTTSLEELEARIGEKTPIFHNSSFDVPVLLFHGFPIRDYEDTMLMSYCIDPSQGHSLKDWGEELGFRKLDHDWKADDAFELTEELEEYARKDAELTWKLYIHLTEYLMNEDAWDLYRNIELPYSQIIQEMERTGVYFDTEETCKFHSEISKEVDELTVRISSEVGDIPDKKPKKYKKEHPELEADFIQFNEEDETYEYQLYHPFNINSRHDKAYALQELYGWQPTEYGKDGTPTVSNDILSELSYPLAKQLTEVAKLIKIKSSFLKPILEYQDNEGFVHANFNQAVTLTGRLSSSNPNMQNIPSRGDLGTRMRRLVTDGFSENITLVGGDLSNIEARVLAYYLMTVEKDRTMADAFINDMDLHQVNADNWGLTRDIAKMVLYLTLYGGGAANLAGRLGIPQEEAQGIIDQVYNKLPALARLKERVMKQARKNGYIRTLLGRRLHYPDINSSNKWKRLRAERQVFNALLQGTAADILKKLSVDSVPIVRRFGAVYVAAVHDESLFYCDSSAAESFAHDLSKAWANSGLLGEIQTAADFKVGSNWGDIH